MDIRAYTLYYQILQVQCRVYQQSTGLCCACTVNPRCCASTFLTVDDPVVRPFPSEEKQFQRGKGDHGVASHNRPIPFRLPSARKKIVGISGARISVNARGTCICMSGADRADLTLQSPTSKLCVTKANIVEKTSTHQSTTPETVPIVSIT